MSQKLTDTEKSCTIDDLAKEIVRQAAKKSGQKDCYGSGSKPFNYYELFPEQSIEFKFTKMYLKGFVDGLDNSVPF